MPTNERQQKGKTRKAILVIGPSIAYLRLTQGKLALIDREDAATFSQWNWHANQEPISGNWYVMRATTVNGAAKKFLLHREIMGVADGRTIDHRNQNPLDNRRANLREATHSQQCFNRRTGKITSTGYRGVSFKANRYEVSIAAHGRSHYLGRFTDLQLAARAYDEAAKRLHGEFASLNFRKAA